MSTRTVYSLIGVCLAGTFLFDCLTPLGYQEFLLYALPILLTLWLEQAWSAYVVAGLATLLVSAGWALSPAGIPAEVALLNRTLSAALFWVIAELVIRSRGAILDRGARQLAALVNSSVDAIISQDPTGTVMTWNAAAERMFGYAAADIVGRSLHVLIPAHRIQQDIATYACIGRGEAVSQYETGWMHREGRVIELSLSLSPILDQSGGVVGISTIAHDIAPLSATMQLLREHEARLDLVVSATRTGVWDWDLRRSTMYYSPLWKESLGYGPDELTDSPSEWETRLHPEDRERAFALVQAYFAGKVATYELDHRLQHRDGTYRWIHTDAVVIRDEQGVPIRMTGSHVDVTERKHAQEALRQSEYRFRRYFELGLIGMAMSAMDKRWIEVNEQLCLMFGYSREELLRLTWADITHPDDLAKNLTQFERVVAGEQDGYVLEKRFIHKSGRVVQTVISSSAMRKDDGSIDHFVVLVQDVTAAREAEASLKESEGTLQAFFESASL
ncbi:MAG: PAS domain S-box protein, partial [Nitrospira sp.]